MEILSTYKSWCVCLPGAAADHILQAIHVSYTVSALIALITMITTTMITINKFYYPIID